MLEQFTAKEWLYIDIANHAGQDKEVYSKRIEWTTKHLSELEHIKGKKPARYAKAVLALRDTQAGRPTGHLVGLDASASGPALLSVLCRCETGMKNTGIINCGGRPDIYQLIIDHMSGNYDRDLVKYAYMPWVYSSERAPALAFGREKARFVMAAKAVAPRAGIMRDVLKKAWQPMALAHQWTMPNNSVVYKRVWQTKKQRISVPNMGNSSFTYAESLNQGKLSGTSLCADLIHSCDGFVVQEMSARCNYNKEEMETVQGLLQSLVGDVVITNRDQIPSMDLISESDLLDYPVNFLAQLLEQVNRCLEYRPFDIVMIHDEFLCHANNVGQKRVHYNRIMWDLYNSNFLLQAYAEITGTKVKNNWPFDEAVANQILEAEYSIS